MSRSRREAGSRFKPCNTQAINRPSGQRGSSSIPSDTHAVPLYNKADARPDSDARTRALADGFKDEGHRLAVGADFPKQVSPPGKFQIVEVTKVTIQIRPATGRYFVQSHRNLNNPYETTLETQTVFQIERIGFPGSIVYERNSLDEAEHWVETIEKFIADEKAFLDAMRALDSELLGNEPLPPGKWSRS
ncbi:hypothetical protein [Burkholderia ubonensis]|uniref:hypothetical protein n=1 Tax=Burkholderia ubonensis TaxID=101571 RepID=UPI000AC3F0CA|nr:hypothetical protein [Burkholderia ubonensis]